jgi:helicase MOV-10
MTSLTQLLRVIIDFTSEALSIKHDLIAKWYFLFSLAVPGLAEKRPSVLVGDQILVQERGATDGRWYEGHVHFVRQADVGLCFHTSFDRFPADRRFHVRFKLNRIPMKRQHQAMDTVFNEERILFPIDHHLPQRPPRVALKLFNGLLSKNEPQLQAVASILSSPAGSPPFVVFGP